MANANIKILCAHSGPTDSGLQAKTTQAGGTGWLDSYLLNRTLSAATEDVTCGIAIACCQPDVKSGEFYGPLGDGKAGPAVLMAEERNEALEKLLWEESLAACEIKDFFSNWIGE